MSSPGQRRTCGHTMALFDSHTRCARCHEKRIGKDPCVEKKPCEICDGFTPEQKQQLATPTYRARKEHQKRRSPSLVDPSSLAVLGKVESGKGESSDRGKSTPSKKKKTSHKSPKKSTKASKAPEYQSDLKNLDKKWSERFARLEALFLAKSFQVPVELVQSSSVVVSDKPFIPPEQIRRLLPVLPVRR